MALISIASSKAKPTCAICGAGPVETVVTPAGRFALCPDHVVKFAARRLPPEEFALAIRTKQPPAAAWEPASCALCASPAALVFDEPEGLFAFCQPHFIRYVLRALRPHEHALLAGRLTPDQFLTRLSAKYYFDGQADQPYIEDLDDPAYSATAPLWE
ncbi:MAG: hypothetical protein EPO02_09210 [Nitrospirae bacterium]|nr:MAG: hypothetical protein EPO02_09210 [Nitrospirota bacterium]